MSNPTRWSARRRLVAAAAASTDLYAPMTAGEVLQVRQLRVSASAPVEVVLYFSASAVTPASAAAIPESYVIFAAHLAANGGASPDLGCLGAWAPGPGLRLRLYVSGAATVNVAAEGVVDE